VPKASPSRSRRIVVGLLGGALAVSSVAGLAGCNAIAGGVAVVVVAGVAVLGYSCGEPVDVTVWDRKAAHNVCDATVTAEQDGTVNEFSPCYRLYLGTGNWNIAAKKDGYVTATGTVSVSKERKCSEPTFHSVALTLHPVGEVQSMPAPVAPPPPAPVVPAAPAPAPASTEQAAPPISPAPTTSSETPKAAFPPASGPAPAP
jgi:hypothetical protein